jgi:molecular chaperone DnaJ
VAGPTHYDTLRIAPSASTAEIRDAYRRLAREHHPDHQVSSGSAAGSSSMPAINEAYRVLGDPARRAVYDAGLRSASNRDPSASDSTVTGGTVTGGTVTGGTRGGAGGPSAPMHPSHVGPARIPWRSMLVLAIVGSIGVVVLAQFTEPGSPPGPDGIFRVGECAEVQADLSVREVACTGDPSIDLVVEAFVPFEGRCPGGTTPYRDRQGMGIACIAEPSPAIADPSSSVSG